LSIDHSDVIRDLDVVDPRNSISYDEMFPQLSIMDGWDAQSLRDLQLGKKTITRVGEKAGEYFVHYKNNDIGIISIDSSGCVKVLKNNV